MKKKRIKSMTAVTAMLCLFSFILWGASVFCITHAVAQNYYQMLLDESYGFADYATLCGRLSSLFEVDGTYEYKQTVPGYTEYCILEAIKGTNSPDFYANKYLNYGSFSVFKDETIPMQSAVLFIDKDGNILHQSGDFIYFPYVTDEIWEEEREEQVTSGNGWINLAENTDGSDPYSFFRVMYNGVRSLYNICALRITGYMDGAEVIPLRIDYVTDDFVWQALDEKTPDEHEVYDDGTEYIRHTYTLSGLDHAGLFEWQTVFDETNTAENTDELLTIYAMYPQMNVYDAGDSVVYQDLEYESLYELLSTEVDYIGNDLSGMREYRLDETIVFAARAFRDLTSYDFTSDEPIPEPEFIMLTAIESRPLAAAASALRYIYVVTFLIAVLGLVIVRSIIKKMLVLPLRDVNGGIAEGWTNISGYVDTPPEWSEPFELYEHYKETQDMLRMHKNERTRLEKALNYTETAEENRRQMTSNIAHELKTPLAIIHSYAEGLNENIAEDKREQYYSVILSETERMNDMVMEMLDLSRLEAGRVKLSREDFSLSEIVAPVFERLERAIEAKDLALTMELDENCMINADMARIEQVITNFAVNAVKYTPSGGNILVRTKKSRGTVMLSVENDSPPLSGEALSKVWETFYSADQSRTASGTGLGLAIAKSIIDLHGGKCSVRNTRTGIEFSFTIEG